MQGFDPWLSLLTMDDHEAIPATTFGANGHLDTETLRRFALGLMTRSQMVQIEGHVAACPTCARRPEAGADDILTRLLRRPIHGIGGKQCSGSSDVTPSHACSDGR